MRCNVQKLKMTSDQMESTLMLIIVYKCYLEPLTLLNKGQLMNSPQ